MSDLYVYAGGPMTGLTKEQAEFWRHPDSDFVKMLANDNWVALDPTRDEEPTAANGEFEATTHDYHKHVRRDLADIDRSAAMVMNLSNAEIVSIGTIAEMGYCFGQGKPIVTVLEDGSIHDHMFVRTMSHVIVPSLRQAVDALKVIRREMMITYA